MQIITQKSDRLQRDRSHLRREHSCIRSGQPPRVRSAGVGEMWAARRASIGRRAPLCAPATRRESGPRWPLRGLSPIRRSVLDSQRFCARESAWITSNYYLLDEQSVWQLTMI